MATIKLQTKPVSYSKSAPQFDKDGFDTVIYQKGYKIIHEKAILCACKGSKTQHLSDCKNCGGSGWFYINPIETRALIVGMAQDITYRQWSALDTGIARISIRDIDMLSFMDRITVLNSVSYHSQVFHINREEDILFCYAPYKMLEIMYAGIFVSSTEKLNRIVVNTDFTIDEHIFYLNEKFLADYVSKYNSDMSISVRYKHKPQYHVIEMTRETMTSNIRIEGLEKQILLPVSGQIRKSHFLNEDNIYGNRIIDNSF